MLLGKRAAERKRAGSESEDLVLLLIRTGPPKRRHCPLAFEQQRAQGSQPAEKGMSERKTM